MFETYKNLLTENRTRIFTEEDRYLHALEASAQYADAIDAIIKTLAEKSIPHQLDPDSWAVLGSGSYGRKDLSPYSDIDIMLLHDGKKTGPLLGPFITALWDSGFTAGVVSRSIADCKTVLGQDPATDSSFLDLRFVAGSRVLFQKLQHSLIFPWFQHRRRWMIQYFHNMVRAGVLSETGSVYKVEPDIKEGICGQRDCQRIFWSMMIRYRLFTPGAPELLEEFRPEDRTAFLGGYSFLTGLRHELHMTYQRRMDVLETARQPEIAKRLGFGDRGTSSLMEAYFKHVTAIRNFALVYLEHTLHPESVFTRFRRRIGAITLLSDLYVADGILFLRKSFSPDSHPDPEWFLLVFLAAVTQHASLSVSLRNFIRIRLAEISPGRFISPRIMHLFRQILLAASPAGEAVLEMHETGLLEKLIPEFGALFRKVEYDTYHEYPVDAHTMLMLKFLDHADEEEHFIRELFRRIPDRGLLRLGFLLHDIGKGMSGDHCKNGAVIAERICYRLGLTDDRRELIVFMVLNHLSISQFSFTFDMEPSALQGFAEQMQNREYFDHLLLLTWFDIKSVSAKALTGWKKKQLKDLYQSISDIFKNRPLARKKEEYSALRADIRKKDDIIFQHEQYDGFERLLVAAFDRKGFLADLVACISSEGYNILSADARTYPDSRIVDILYIQPDETTLTRPRERLKAIKRKWDLLVQHSVSAGELIQNRGEQYPLKKIRQMQTVGGTTITIDNDHSPDYSVLQITVPDRFGLLFTITKALLDLDCTIVSAKLATKIDDAVDTFYILDAAENKIATGISEMIDYLKQRLEQE